MLDEFGAEMEEAETKLDATMRKMSKVLHMSNGKKFGTRLIVRSHPLLLAFVTLHIP